VTAGLPVVPFLRLAWPSPVWASARQRSNHQQLLHDFVRVELASTRAWRQRSMGATVAC
jgi:hypothetical protein